MCSSFLGSLIKSYKEEEGTRALCDHSWSLRKCKPDGDLTKDRRKRIRLMVNKRSQNPPTRRLFRIRKGQTMSEQSPLMKKVSNSEGEFDI